MALCLASSLIVCRGFLPYDQLVRYQWWYRFGYMSSTGHCFDIGDSTRQALDKFHRRQITFARQHKIAHDKLDCLSDSPLVSEFDTLCGSESAESGGLVRLAPVPLFFYRYPLDAIKYAGSSGQITHGDIRVEDACRYYSALIVAAVQGSPKDQLLDNHFYSSHRAWFGNKSLHPNILSVASGSYKKPNGYDGGIRGRVDIVSSLEAALWAFWSTSGFRDGALAAVNLGDDTATTTAIYGQLAGAYYGYHNLPSDWNASLYAIEFFLVISKWILYEGECFPKSTQ